MIPTKRDCDLIIVGGGPAGLTAAINAASEGLHVCIVDGAMALGGQAKESNAIENYPLPHGFPEGVSGEDLMTGFIEQARKFQADMFCPVTAASLRREDNMLIVQMDDYQEFSSKTVLLANGLSYRRLDANGIGAFMGRGVYYGLPTVLPTNKYVCVVGGANSAGQAALKLCERNQVTMVIRKTLDAQMSAYLVSRIRRAEINVVEYTEISACIGDRHLAQVRYSTGDRLYTCEGLYIFIGAMPRTMWLGSVVDLDPNRFVLTDQHGIPFETSMPGVFACGDVRANSTKRIAAAIGEAVGALQMIHRQIDKKEEK